MMHRITELRTRRTRALGPSGQEQVDQQSAGQASVKVKIVLSLSRIFLQLADGSASHCLLLANTTSEFYFNLIHVQ